MYLVSTYTSTSLRYRENNFHNQTVGMFLFLICNDCVFTHGY